MFTLFQVNIYENTVTQQGYFTFTHHWLIVLEDESQLSIVEQSLGNVTNLAAIVPAVHEYDILKVSY